MDLLTHFQLLARYNRIANERLFDKCSHVGTTEYRQQRHGSFGSIHGLLNHLLLGDQIWMARFKGAGHETPPLDRVLFAEFHELRQARVALDVEIEGFFNGLEPEFLKGSFRYKNNQDKDYAEEAPVAISHFFNHQTHHRGQVHVMLSQTMVRPPSLDLHRIINP